MYAVWRHPCEVEPLSALSASGHSTRWLPDGAGTNGTGVSRLQRNLQGPPPRGPLQGASSKGPSHYPCLALSTCIQVRQDALAQEVKQRGDRSQDQGLGSIADPSNASFRCARSPCPRILSTYQSLQGLLALAFFRLTSLCKVSWPSSVFFSQSPRAIEFGRPPCVSISADWGWSTTTWPRCPGLGSGYYIISYTIV
jgi:hypothetical protein